MIFILYGIYHCIIQDTEPLYHGNQAAIYIPPIYQQALVPGIEGHIDTWHMQALVHVCIVYNVSIILEKYCGC